jgi:hypothetical protein
MGMTSTSETHMSNTIKAERLMQARRNLKAARIGRFLYREVGRALAAGQTLCPGMAEQWQARVQDVERCEWAMRQAAR